MFFIIKEKRLPKKIEMMNKIIKNNKFFLKEYTSNNLSDNIKLKLTV